MDRFSTPSTSIAFQGGSRLVKCVHSTTVTGSGRSMVVEETQLDQGIGKNYDISFRAVHMLWAV